MSDEQMTLDELRVELKRMIVNARARFRDEAMRLCHTEDERSKATAIEMAVGDVSPEEAVLAFKRWLAEERASR
jgi:hypothetical protein